MLSDVVPRDRDTGVGVCVYHVQGSALHGCMCYKCGDSSAGPWDVLQQCHLIPSCQYPSNLPIHLGLEMLNLFAYSFRWTAYRMRVVCPRAN